MVANLKKSKEILSADPGERYVRDRLVWNPAMHAIPISGIRRMVNRAAELEDVVHLSIGQPDFATPRHIIDAHIHALEAGQTGYTMDAGLPELLTALKEYYNARYRSTLTEDNFLITTGATEGIYLLITAMAAPGREFIIADPTFLLYAPLIRMNGGQPCELGQNTPLSQRPSGSVERVPISTASAEPCFAAVLRVALAGEAGEILVAAVGRDAELRELQLIVSEPGAAAQDVHSDSNWSADAPRLVTMFVALHDLLDERMGPTRFWPNTHAPPWLPPTASLAAERRPVWYALRAGDAVLMDACTWHRGGANTSGSRRFLLAATFVAAANGEGVPRLGDFVEIT